MNKFKLSVLFLLCLSAFATGHCDAHAQRLSVSSNVLELANLGTLNAEAGVAVGRHFSIHAQARVNPWVFREGSAENRITDPAGVEEKQFQNKKQAYDLSLRFWPWYVYSGWWFSLRAQYMEYDYGGILNTARQAGDSYGGGLSVGYSYILFKNLNLDFGMGVWGGYRQYGRYLCTNCGKEIESGNTWFIVPDDIRLSLVLVF